MRKETITRLRNAFAQVALDLMAETASEAVVAEHGLPFSSMTEDDWRQAVTLWRRHAAELLAALPDRPCPACDSDRSRWLFESYDAHPFHECRRCGCWFEPKIVDSGVFEQLFARSPQARTLANHMMSERDGAGQRDADMARVGGYLDDLLPLLPQPDRHIAYLDAGCGVGHSLRAGLARGLTVQGVEVDRTAIDLARADGLPVAALADRIPPGPYDLLSFWETIEHIANPLEALDRFVPYLADDGLVAITVPNLNAFATRTLREACPWIHGGYNTPGHVNLFHAPALDRLLSRAGLTLIDADGQFSANPLELATYLAGERRGVFDALESPLQSGRVSRIFVDVLNNVWPGVALVERTGLASPILQVIACRRGREASFASAISARQSARRRHIEEEAEALIAGEPDYKTMAAALREELALRDDLLEEARARFDGTLEGRALTAMRAVGRLARRFALRFSA